MTLSAEQAKTIIQNETFDDWCRRNGHPERVGDKDWRLMFDDAHSLGYTACLRDSEGVVAANSRSFAEVIIRIGERYETKHFTKLEIVSLRFPGQRLKDEAERMIDAALRLAENKPITGGE